jgi:hypothetical protein
MARKGIAMSEQKKPAVFPKTLAAARELLKAEVSLCALHWAWGDALIEECGPPGENGVRSRVYGRIEDAHKALKQEGVRAYSLAHLRDLRRLAAAFPAADRSSAASWTVHREAGDPQTRPQPRKRRASASQ